MQSVVGSTPSHTKVRGIMQVVHVDFETRSTVDLRLTGSWKYAGHFTTSVNCMAWCIDDGPINMWSRGNDFPKELERAIKGGCIMAAWNAQFERHMWGRCQSCQDWPVVAFEQWRCTAAKSRHANHPGGLDAAVKLVLPQLGGKDSEGAKVMMKMAKPHKWTKKEIEDGRSGIKWVDDVFSQAILENYCVKDVEIERAMDRALPEWPESEVKVWQVNERVNDRGVPFDKRLCTAATDILNTTLETISVRISEKTEGVITTGGQIQRIKEYVNKRGVNVDSLAANVIEGLLETDLDDEVRDILHMRQISSGAAAKKYQSALDVMDEDDRGRGLFMYYGASATGRFASLKTQIQNMKKGSDKSGVFLSAVMHQDMGLLDLMYNGSLITELGKNVRAMVCAGEGSTLVRCDSSQIEVRVLHALARNEKMLKTFSCGRDPYCEFASKVMNRTISKGDKERQLGKSAILGLGFGMGAKRFVESSRLQYGLELTEKFALQVVKTYRNEHSKVPKFWRDLENAAHKCVTRRQAMRVGFITFGMWGDYMVVKLPSGRRLFYYQPAFEGKGRDIRFVFTSPRGVRYEWAGGLLCENVVQATARDTLVHYMALAEQRGLDVVAHIHDELVVECRIEDAEETSEALLNIFATQPAWAAGIPLAAEATTGRRYA